MGNHFAPFASKLNQSRCLLPVACRCSGTKEVHVYSNFFFVFTNGCKVFLLRKVFQVVKGDKCV